MTKAFVIIIMFCSCCTMLRSQNTDKKDTLDALKINNKSLFSILDSVVNFEKHCDYYKPDLIFFVHLYSSKGSNWVQVGSLGFELMNTSTNALGCFTYRNHFFLVTGQYLDKTIFSKTNEKREIKHYEKSNDGVIDVYEDDSFTFWVYKYINEDFIYDCRSTYCD